MTTNATNNGQTAPHDRAAEASNLLAAGVDALDEAGRRMAEAGIDVDQRGQALASMLERITRPETIDAINTVVDALPKLAPLTKLATEAPNVVATLVDVFDEYAQRLEADGISLEQALTGGLHATLYLGSQIREQELDRLGELLRSDALNKQTVDAIAQASSALVDSRNDTCDITVDENIGVFALLRMLKDPNIQKSLSFGIRFAKCFGRRLDNPGAGPSC